MIAQDFDDFLYSESSGQGSELIASGGISASAGVRENALFDPDFYDDWDDDADDFFSNNNERASGASAASGIGSGSSNNNGNMDDEDRRFFEELSKGLNENDQRQ